MKLETVKANVGAGDFETPRAAWCFRYPKPEKLPGLYHFCGEHKPKGER